jgi:hypothetical protein
MDKSPTQRFEESTVDLNIRVLDICERATGEMFLIWRRIIRIKHSTHHRFSHQQADVSENVIATRTAVDDFEQRFRPMMKQYMENFLQLSKRSKTVSGQPPFPNF